MSGVNRVILLGRLGKDPEGHNVNGKTVANFSMATSVKYKDKTTGESKEDTEWHNIVIWGALGDVAVKYLKKGDSVYVEGKLRTRSWEKDGVKRYTTEVIVNEMTMLGGGRAAAKPAEKPAAPQESAPSNFDPSTDDLPF